MSRKLWIPLAALFLQACAQPEPQQAPVEQPEARVWTTIDTNGEPTARHEVAMVAFGGKAYLLGGRGVKPVEEFDPATNTWRQLGPTPLEMHHFQPVVFGDRVYVMTAMTGGYPKETPLETIYIWDPVRDVWEQGPAIPEARRRGGAGTVVHDGKIYLVAGIIDGHTSGTVPWFDEFDPPTGEWRQLPDAPHARDHFSAVVVGGEIYAVGGRNTSYHEPDNFAAFFAAVIPEVDVYDFESGQWRTLANDLPNPTAAGGLVELEGDIYYFGGETSQDVAHNTMQRLDVAAGTWTLEAPLERGRHGSGAVVIDGKIYVAAGSGGRGGGPELSSTEVYAPVP